jgi:raffinose/stachyose/melibiose transport system permease protein
MVRKVKHSPVFWVFLAPVLLAFLLVIVIPFFLGVYFSFTDWSASAANAGGLNWVGLMNYDKSLQDPKFLYSFGVTSVYTILNMIAVNVVAFLLALLVSSRIKGRNVYRAGFFVPNLIGGLVLGFVWQFIFNSAVPILGPAVGLPFLADPKNLLLASNVGATLALVIVGTWQYAGYIMMIYLAAIQSVPVELHEAAQIDGAGPTLRLWRITVPMVAQAFTVTMFLTLINSFKHFDVNVSLTAGGPSTMFMGHAISGTQLLAMNIYNTAFGANDMAQGQARAVIFFLILVVISIVQVSVGKKKEVEL